MLVMFGCYTATMADSETSDALTGVSKLIYDSVDEAHCLGTGGTHSVFRLADPNFADVGVRIPNFMLDVHQKHGINITAAPFDMPKPSLKRVLLASTSLTPVTPCYLGEGIGQHLMTLYGKDDGVERPKGAPPQPHEFVDTEIGFVRLEEGKSLAKLYEAQDKAGRAAMRKELLPHYAALQEQVTRLAYHSAPYGYLLDSHTNNILFDPKKGLSLVDAYNPAENYRDAATHAIAAGHDLIEDIMTLFHDDMDPSETSALQSHLEAHQKILNERVKTGSLDRLNETGFAKVTQAQVVPMTSPPHALRAELNKMQQEIRAGIAAR